MIAMKKSSIFIMMVLLLLMVGCSKQQGEQSPSQGAQAPSIETDTSSAQPSSDSEPHDSSSLSSEAEPLYQKLQEYSITIDGKSLGLGSQVGAFPWETTLEKRSADYWSMDGFDSFEITCEDGTIIQGLRGEGIKDENNGLITEISTSNPAYQTYRGACVGMSSADVLALYPEAVPAKADQTGYCFTDEGIGFKRIFFWVKDDVLTSIVIEDGIDG